MLIAAKSVLQLLPLPIQFGVLAVVVGIGEPASRCGLESNEIPNARAAVLVGAPQGFLSNFFRCFFQRFKLRQPVLREVTELLGDLDAGKKGVDLSFEVCDLETPLRAGRMPAFRAVVVGVAESRGLAHGGNGNSTAGAVFSPARGEFEAAAGTDELMLFLGGHHAAALSAAQKPAEREDVGLRTRPTAIAEDDLGAVILLARDNRRMLSRKPLPASSRKLEEPGVEGVGENLVNGAACKRLSPPCAVAPLVSCDLKNPGWRVKAGQQQIPHAPHKGKALRVFDDRLATGSLGGIVKIPLGRNARVPAALSLGAATALHIAAQVVDVLLRESEFDVGEERGIVGVPERLGRRYDL